ncbi:MAG: hypothetical protein ACLRPF_11345, partial [Blautia sp.]
YYGMIFRATQSVELFCAYLMTANRKSRQTLILITHDENIALQADRIITISDGRIIRDEVIRG